MMVMKSSALHVELKESNSNNNMTSRQTKPDETGWLARILEANAKEVKKWPEWKKEIGIREWAREQEKYKPYKKNSDVYDIF